MVKKEEYTGKSDPDYYFKYAMPYGDSMLAGFIPLEKAQRSWI